MDEPISDNMATILANTRPRSDSFDDDFKAAKELFVEKYEAEFEALKDLFTPRCCMCNARLGQTDTNVCTECLGKVFDE